jgi:hypothetical protein
MRDEELPQWLREIGRRPKERQIGRPVPPISGSIKVEREFNPIKAASLERDFSAAIDDSMPEQESDLHVRILDCMTGNRLEAPQAYRLLLKLWAKNGGGLPGLSRVDSSGNLEALSWSTV